MPKPASAPRALPVVRYADPGLPQRHKRNESERRTNNRHVNRQDRTGDTLTLDVTGPIVVRVGPPHRHAMPVLSPIESCSRARSSGVECPKTTHMNSTVAISTNIKVSTPRIAPSRCPAHQNPRSPPSTLESPSLNAPRPSRWVEGSAVAVVVHR